MTTTSTNLKYRFAPLANEKGIKVAERVLLEIDPNFDYP